MNYPPVRIAKAGSFIFDPNGVLSLQGWTFDMCGRATPEGVHPFVYWRDDLIIAAWAHLNDYIECKLGITVVKASDEPVNLASVDLEISAQQVAEALIKRAKEA
ncbi:hypothetical protein ACPCHQ_16935 [Ralstonia thomasii]|jgi:hypothetical protein|uniref:Uncharacterized protein n=2 Tax=Ralstonia TaxID=48736 RepID=A0ABM9JWY7_9RALS|nr:MULTISPECIES: hypothetical protein [Ralstonia]MBT2177772.1 hypothetical protein [Ralstonia pickettii]CAJ0710661.1 hypothetical protein LMG7143_01672 [Ralstonia sp. LMG 18095]CAJ0806379.1 hypothetical protein LMG18095_04433 [Ralstonia sp. LMG 18095]